MTLTDCLYKNIEIAQEGLSKILKDERFHKLVSDFHLSNHGRERFRMKDYDTLMPQVFFNIYDPKHFPGDIVSDFIYTTSEFHIKWYLLFDSLSKTMDLYESYIGHHLDEGLRSGMRLCWEEFDLHRIPEEERTRLLSSILAGIGISNLRRVSQITSDSIALFVLTAGYYYQIVHEIISDIISKRVDLPFILASSLYTYIVTGADIYDTIRQQLANCGKEDALDDVLLMCKKNREMRRLEQEKRELLYKISQIDEEYRKQETAGEIISQMLDQDIPASQIEQRIEKCNSPFYRELLYKFEKKTGQRLSFIDSLNQKGISPQIRQAIAEEYRVIFSEKEQETIDTIEDFISTILLHKDFIERTFDLKSRTNPIISADDPYDVKTRAKEIARKWGTAINIDSINSVADIYDAVASRDELAMRLRVAISEKLDVDISEVTETASLSYDLGADSLDIVELIMDLEKEYGIEIPDETWTDVYTIGDIIRTIKRLLNESSI